MNQTHEIISDDIFNVLDNLITVPVLLFNQDRILYANKSYVAMFEIPSLQKLQDFIQEKPIDNKKELVLRSYDGQDMYAEYNARTVLYHKEECVLVEIHDVTDKKRLEQNLERIYRVRERMLKISQSVLEMDDINEIYNMILKNALDCIENAQLGSIFRLDENCFTLVAYNGYASDIEGFTLQVEESTLYKMTDGRMDQTKCMKDISLYDCFYPVRTQYGEEKIIKSTITTPIRIKGKLFGMINIDSIKTDVFTEDDLKTMEFIRNSVEIALTNHILYEKAIYLAQHDALTGMYNRAQFSAVFTKTVQSFCEKSGTFQVAMFDMNGLKRLNDNYGHLIGDIAVKAVATSIWHATKNKDVTARIGGDEFCGLYYETSMEELTKRFEAELGYLKEHPCKEDGCIIDVSFSYGIATYPKDGIDFAELTRIADERMYQYKRKIQGVNRV